MGPDTMADGEGRGNIRGPLYTSWDEILENGSEELKAVLTLITDGVPPGHNPYTGKPYNIQWKQRRKKDGTEGHR